jgi:hypothetical protein
MEGKEATGSRHPTAESDPDRAWVRRSRRPPHRGEDSHLMPAIIVIPVLGVLAVAYAFYSAFLATA